MEKPIIATLKRGRRIPDQDSKSNVTSRKGKIRQEAETWLEGCSQSTQHAISTHEMTAFRNALWACMLFADNNPERDGEDTPPTK